MSYQIDVQNDEDFPVDAARLQAAAAMVLTQQGAAADAALTIVITTDDEAAALNRQFRGIDAPTDVLSFPIDAPPVDIPGEPQYLGDLLIAHPYAAAQAQREGHDLSDSLSLLVAHGTLHLLGYDHDTPTRRAAMWQAQEQALRALGIAPDIVPVLEGENDADE